MSAFSTSRVIVALALAAAGIPSSAGAEPLPVSPAGAPARPGPIGRGDDADAKALLGTRPPDLPAIRWLDGEERSLESLAGRVVLIRSFTNACPFCAASITALEAIHRDYAGRDLVVLGVYHPKPPRPLAPEDVAGLARSLGATFPVGLDPDWRLVEDWWIERTSGGWTSVTWILGPDGLLRYIHPGGEYHAGGGTDHHRCREDERDIRQVIDRLLSESGPRVQPDARRP